MRSRLEGAIIVALVASLGAACITVETVNAQSGPVQTLRVDIQGNAFVPPDIIVLKGSKVTWTNKDSTFHTVTNKGGSESIREFFAPAAASAAAVQDYTFNNLGVIEYYCEVHPSMTGSVTVVEEFDATEFPIINVSADDDNQFSPKQVSLNASQAITWTNVGQNLHDVTFENESIGSLGDLQAGASVSFNFTKEGTYAYRCKYHSADFKSGMVGHVAVGPNAVLPPVVSILFPPPGANVSGNVSIAGTAEASNGNPPITSIEFAIDNTTNWTKAEGTRSWSFTWDSRLVEDGNHTLIVRAMAEDQEVARAEQPMLVSNGPRETVAAPTKADGGVPGPGALVVLVGLLCAVRFGRAARFQ